MMHYQTKHMIREALGNLSAWFYNLLYFTRRSQHFNDQCALRNFVLSLPQDLKDQYASECLFVETMALDDLSRMITPYHVKERADSCLDIMTGEEDGLPFVVHGQGSKLFFPRHTSQVSVLNEYKVLVECEGLLGSGVLEKSPHCYQDEDFKVENGDILLDVGCAEAIFALDNIDKISKAYLFECLPEWRKPLRRTFAPYMDKVVFVDKLVSDKTQGNSITLVDAVKADMVDDVHFFVKMDIEGWERTVIKGNADFFKRAKVKLSCCVYHRQDDAQVIEKMLNDMGYKTRFSDGYMLPTMNGIHYPYFRHGVIYAQNY